jgi:hypothetical protein
MFISSFIDLFKGVWSTPEQSRRHFPSQAQGEKKSALAGRQHHRI